MRYSSFKHVSNFIIEPGRSSLFLILILFIQSCSPTLTPTQKENKVVYQLAKIESKYPAAYQTVISRPDFGITEVVDNPTPNNVLVAEENPVLDPEEKLVVSTDSLISKPKASSGSQKNIGPNVEDTLVSLKDNLDKSIADSISISNSVHYNNETVEFTIHSQGNVSMSNKSIFRITIEDAKGEFLINHVALIRNEDFSGSFLIPEQTVTGTYILRCRDLNLGLEVYNQYFSVINLRTYRENMDSKECCPKLVALKDIETASKDPLEIRGHLGSEIGQTLSGVPITFQSRGDTEEFIYTQSNENGEFRFNNPLYGKNEIYISTADGNSLSEIIDDLPYSSSSPGKLNPYRLNEQFVENVDNLSQLVISYNYPDKPEMTNEFDDPLFVFDEVVVVDDYVPMSTTEETLQEIVPYLKIKKSKKRGSSVHLLDFTNNMFHKGEPLLLIDGFKVRNIEQIFALDIENLESINVVYNSFNNTGVIGKYGLFGLLYIQTRKGDYVPDQGLYFEVSGLLFNSLLTY